MYISYEKLWKLLIEKHIKKTDLILICGISSRTLTKLSKNQSVNSDTILRICEALNCELTDIMELCREDKGKENSFYKAFAMNKVLINSDEFCKTYTFEYGNKRIILKKTIQKANKHTVIHCKENSVVWEQIYPVGIYPARVNTVISDASFCGKDHVCVLVITGRPMCIEALDEGIWKSAEKFPGENGSAFVMSEARMKLL